MDKGKQSINGYWFVKLSNYFRVFRSFCLEISDCTLNKARLLRMLELETMPTQIGYQFAATMFEIFKTDTVNFFQFGLILFYREIYDEIKTKNSPTISLEDFKRLRNSYNFPQ